MKMLLLRLHKLSLILQSRLFLSALWKRCVAGVEHSAVLGHLACTTVVDVGANRGQFALAARNAWPDCSIYSFEPLQEARDIYHRVFANDQKAQLFPYAIGSKRTQGVIHVSQEDDSSSLLPISEKQSELFPGTEEKETRSIQVMRLSDLLPVDRITSPALLKIDVQGYELEVLRGSEERLPSFDYVYVECSFVELYQGQALGYQVIDYLHQRNFQLCGIYNLYHQNNGIAIQADFLFTKRPA